jgi:hypothetical protein
MKNEPWKPTGLQKFNEFCMAVNKDYKSSTGQKFEEEYQQKALEAYAGKKLCKRERLVLLPPLLCILMWRVSPPAVVWHQLRAVSM